MSFRFDVKVIKIPIQSLLILLKEIVALSLYYKYIFNNKKLVYLGLIKFSLIKKESILRFILKCDSIEQTILIIGFSHRRDNGYGACLILQLRYPHD
jgi:hypothetical protein